MMRIEEVFVLICVISLQLLAILFPCLCRVWLKIRTESLQAFDRLYTLNLGGNEAIRCLGLMKLFSL